MEQSYLKPAVLVFVLMTIAGCTTTAPQLTLAQEIETRCLGMGFKAGSEAFSNCQLQLTQTAMSVPRGPLMTPPAVAFQPLPMPQSYGAPTVNLQTNCTTTTYGNMANTNCY